MIPLLIFALVLSAGALTYESSPKAREWFATHMQALTAHRAATTHLATAKSALRPKAAVQHARLAAAANRDAAMAAATAARDAWTEQQRAAAARNAVSVLDQGAAIAETLADASLHAATAEPDPNVAVEHVAEAAAANREAVKKAAEAAELVQTQARQEAAARVAAQATARDTAIASAFAKLGVGQCGARSYVRVTPQIKDALIAKLHGEGMTITGDNPWDIDTHNYDVRLRAVWDPKAQTLKLIVTSGEGGYFGLVTCDEIWKKIDPILKVIVGS